MKKSNSKDLDLLDFKNSDSILKTVVELYNEIWTDSKKWEVNLQKIEQYLTKLLNINPDNTRALINLGAILSDRGKHKNALIELKKAEKLNSKDANLYRNIAIVKMNIESERQNAKEYFEIAKTMESDKLTIQAYFDLHGH